jgi:geranylgeranyl diphosphate synthase, type II
VDLRDFLAVAKSLVEERLKASFSAIPATSGLLKEAMEYSLFSDGKRIRPAMAVAACEAMDGHVDDVLPFAAAIEMIHTYSLIHDDLPSMDNDDLRRGRPTCHKVYGEAVALLAGDALLTEAFRVMAEPRGSRLPKSIVQRIIYHVALGAGASGMVAGQTMDVIYEGKKGTKKILNYIHRNKTSALIKSAVLAGAIAGRAKRTQLRSFATFGESVGLAFQIKDDLLDVEGDEGEVGKKLKKDVDKQTYVRHYGVTASKERMAQLVERALSSIAFLGAKGDILAQIAGFVGQRSS